MSRKIKRRIVKRIRRRKEIPVPVAPKRSQ
jgi:hypothetical protein